MASNGLKPRQDTKKSGGPSIGAMVLVVILGMVLSSAGYRLLGTVIVVGVVALLCGLEAARKRRSGSAADRPAPPAKDCPNPEAHRHFEAPKPQKKRYDTFAQPVRAPSDTERRLANVQRLYEAGLLTRDEYEQEVRRFKGGG